MEQRFETVASFPTPVAAELAAAALREEGFEVHVRDANASALLPHLAAALGYVKLDVPVEDAERARQLLRSIEKNDADDLTDEVRCPKCDSTYLRERGAKLQCLRCEHRFAPEDAAEPHHGAGREGYRGRAKRPPRGHDVFRLQQNSKGTGLFVGFLLGMVMAMALGHWLWFVVTAALCWFLGWKWVYLVCSDPQCRRRLRSDTRRCPACQGFVQGDIDRAADHWVRRAALRRSRD